MGRDSISSQEIGEYTNVNATQIRRDLSGFGKFGKRGVGYNIDYLIVEIRKILRTSGQHNIALIGAGSLGQAIAKSPAFADHGFNITAVFDTDPVKIGEAIGDMHVQSMVDLNDTVRERNIIVGVLAVPGSCRASGGQRACGCGREDHLQLRGLVDRHPVGRDGASIQSRGRVAARAVLSPDVAGARLRRHRLWRRLNRTPRPSIAGGVMHASNPHGRDRRYRLLADAVSDAVAVVVGGSIVEVNPAFSSVFGYTPGRGSGPGAGSPVGQRRRRASARG